MTNAINAATPDNHVTLAENHGAEFTNDVMFEILQSGKRYAVHFDPIEHDAVVATHALNPEKLEPSVKNVNWRKLEPDPHDLVQAAVGPLMEPRDSR